MPKEIIQLGHPALREVAKEIAIDQIGSDSVQSLISDMKESLETQSDGIGLSAPQIADTRRMFIVSHKMFENQPDAHDMIFINPVVTHYSKATDVSEEGCLSIRGIYGNVERPSKVTIIAYNEKGEKHEYQASGMLGRIFQHEIDHLDGILFIDKATDIKELPYEA